MLTNYRRTLPYLFIFSFLLLTACTGSQKTLQHPTTSATLWAQNAGEYNAVTTSIYRNALSNLSLALEDSYWTASIQQKNAGNYQNLPPAVIMDVDETVLDNSAFQARMIKQSSSFDIEQWNNWVMEAKADVVPGALHYAKMASENGIEVIYLTNREASVEEGTRKNLKQLGFPLSADADLILSKNEKEEWTSAKVNRRGFVAENFRVLMLFGDNLNDFFPAKDITQEKRYELVEKHTEKWGREWYILPNPVYGSWEQALYNFNNSLTDKEINEVKKSKLNTKN